MKCHGCGHDSAVAYRWASVFVSGIDDGLIMRNAEPELHFCDGCWARGLAAMMPVVAQPSANGEFDDDEPVVGHGFPVE